MYTLKAQNKYGDIIELTHNEAYVIENIIGIDPPDAVINTTRNANSDGSIFNSAYVDDRQITITMAINSPAETNRINLYKYFKNKYPVRLYYRNGTRDVYIDGYCKNIAVEFFGKKQIAQITVVCPAPFFVSTTDTRVDFSSVQELFEFPFCIETPDPDAIPFSEIILEEDRVLTNPGDVEVGVEIFIKALGGVTNPIIYNAETSEYMKLNVSLSAGDEVYICTKAKEKSITLTSSGVTTSLIGKLTGGSTWLLLYPGDNTLGSSADSNPENMDIYCVVTGMYEGV